MEWFKFLQALDRVMFGRPRSHAESGEIAMADSYGLAALRIARAELGNGEIGGNNRGAHVEGYRAADGTGGKAATNQSWCASFVSACFMLGNPELPFKTSRGAKKLTRNIGKAGVFCAEPVEGAVICWNRGTNPRNSWMGHVALVSHYDEVGDTMKIIEGNYGPYPALVQERVLPLGAWRRRLYKIALI